MKGKVSGIEIRVEDIDSADLIAELLQENLGFQKRWKFPQ